MDINTTYTKPLHGGNMRLEEFLRRLYELNIGRYDGYSVEQTIGCMERKAIQYGIGIEKDYGRSTALAYIIAMAYDEEIDKKHGYEIKDLADSIRRALVRLGLYDYVSPRDLDDLYDMIRECI